MADLGAHKDKNAARLARLAKSKSVPLADPMVGYPKAREAERKASPFARNEPTAQTDTPQEAAPPVAMPDAPTAAPVAAETPPVDAPAMVPDAGKQPAAAERKAQPRKPKEPEPSADATPDGQKPETVEAKLSFQVREEDYPRILAVAEKLGVSPENIVKKAAQMVSPIDADFREGSATRSGPVYRRTVKFPKAAVETWLSEHDPLGLAQNLGISLRQVGCNAFDRAAAELLKNLESRKAKR